MNIQTLVGAVTLLLCSSLVTADMTSTEVDPETSTGDDSTTTVTSSSSREDLSESQELSTKNETATGDPVLNSLSPSTSVTSDQATQTAIASSTSPISAQTSNTASASVSSSSFPSTTSPAILPNTDSPSHTTTTETSPEITVLSGRTTISSLQTSEIHESTTGGSSIPSQSNTISKTPVVPRTDAAVSSTTSETNQHSTNTMESTENSQKSSEEPMFSNLTENSNQNENETSEEMFNITQNETLTTMPTGKGTTHETSTEMTESPNECNMARQEGVETEETMRHYYILTVILVLVMNLGFCLVTVFCVHRITKHYNTRSWDPPPIRYGSKEHGARSFPRNPRWHSTAAPNNA